MEETLSARQFSDLVGVSNVYISRLVKEGRLPTINKRIPREAGLIAYEENKKPGYDVLREAAASNRKKQPQITVDIPKPAPPPEVEMPVITTGTSAAKTNEQYNKARAIEKTLQVKLKEIELKEAQGKLVPIEDVKHDASQLAAMIRQKLISIAPIIAATAEGKTSTQIQRIVEIEINEALKDLQKLEV